MYKGWKILKYALGNWSVRFWIEIIWHRIISLVYCSLHSKLISGTVKIGASLNILLTTRFRSREFV